MLLEREPAVQVTVSQIRWEDFVHEDPVNGKAKQTKVGEGSPGLGERHSIRVQDQADRAHVRILEDATQASDVAHEIIEDVKQLVVRHEGPHCFDTVRKRTHKLENFAFRLTQLMQLRIGGIRKRQVSKRTSGRCTVDDDDVVPTAFEFLQDAS